MGFIASKTRREESGYVGPTSGALGYTSFPINSYASSVEGSPMKQTNSRAGLIESRSVEVEGTRLQYLLAGHGPNVFFCMAIRRRPTCGVRSFLSSRIGSQSSHPTCQESATPRFLKMAST